MTGPTFRHRGPLTPMRWLLSDPILPRATYVLLAAGMVMMLVLLIFVGRWLTFWYDEWDWVLHRRDPTLETLLTPHVDHLSAVPVLVYQGLLRSFGLSSYYPYLAITWALHFASVTLLFLVASRRAGPLIGLAAGLSLLFLGSAFENLLQPFQMSFLLPTTFGLLAIERLSVPAPSRTRYVIAGSALVVAVGSSSVGVLFLGLVLAWALLDRDRTRLLTAVPALVLYALWYVTWGRSSSGLTGTSETDLALIPAKLLYGLGAAAASLAGLPPARFAWVGLGGAVVVAILVVFGRRYGLRFTSLACAALIALLAEYGLQAVFRARFGLEQSSRSAYLYPAAIFIWLAAAELFAPFRDRLTRRIPVMAAMAAVLTMMVIGNMVQFVGAARGAREFRRTEIAQLRLLESMSSSPHLDAGAVMDPELMPQISAGAYLEAISILGRPHLAIPEPTLHDLGPVDPQRMDAALFRLLGDSFVVTDQGRLTPPQDIVLANATVSGRSDECLGLEPQDGGGSVSWVPRGSGTSVRSVDGSTVDVKLAVFGEPISAPTTRLEPDGARTFALPELPAGLEWRVLVTMSDGQLVEICDVG